MVPVNIIRLLLLLLLLPFFVFLYPLLPQHQQQPRGKSLLSLLRLLLLYFLRLKKANQVSQSVSLPYSFHPYSITYSTLLLGDVSRYSWLSSATHTDDSVIVFVSSIDQQQHRVKE